MPYALKTCRILAPLACLAVLAASMATAGEDADPGQMVIGLSMSGEQRAYPIGIFREEMVVSDTVRDIPIIVYFNPREGKAAAFFSQFSGEPLLFSGRAADYLADDLTTATTWSMKTGGAVSGSLTGMRMVPIPFRLTTLGEWRSRNPRGVLYSAAAGPAEPGEGEGPR